MSFETIPSTNLSTVSAVIVNFNAEQWVVDCLTSVLPHVSEVLLIDNASTDASIVACSLSFVGETKLRIIRNEANFGFAIACNNGSKQANSNLLLFLNPDCRLNPRAVSELVRVLESDRSVGMVGGLLLNPDGSEQGGGRRAIPTPWRSFVRAFGLYRFANRWPRLFFDFHLHKQPLPTQPIEVEAVSGACMLVKRSAMEDVGSWDEGYFLHCEDLDLCMRFRQKGWKILFVPSARVTHALGISSRSRPIFVEWHKHKGMMRFYRKFFRHQYPNILMAVVALGVWLRFGLVATIHIAKRLIGRN
jgi:GT2 family glycosyltransferase